MASFSDTLYAALFPGQGAQYVGMGMRLYDESAVGRDILDTAGSVLGPEFLDILRTGPEDALMATDVSQPAIFAVSYAMWQAVITAYPDFTPAAAAGLSLGEYTALAAAGALPFEQGLELVQKRGELMHSAAQNAPGTMASILGLDAEMVTEACTPVDGAYVANYNSPGQVVISGERAAIEKACAACQAAGARRVIPLKVSGAFHSPLMEEAREGLLPILEKIEWKTPAFPVLSNVTGVPYTSAEEIPTLLARQVVESVRWEDNCRYMLLQGCETFYELGPGNVLQGLMRKIERSAIVVSAESMNEMEIE